jgi:cobalt-zinc-cadmium efflux system outer membrane protein
VIRSAAITRFAAVGATIALLWSYPAAAAEQTMPGATVESVGAIAKSLKIELQAKYAEMERLAGGSL